MQLRIGYELRYHFPQPTPVILMLNVHDTRIPDLERPDAIVLEPPVPISGYSDVFAKPVQSHPRARRRDAHLDRHHRARYWAAGPLRAGCGPGSDPGPSRRHAHVPDREPLLRQRSAARSGVDAVRPHPSGWARVQAVSDFVHQRIAFGYEHASVSRSAWQAYEERRGVCRDYAHLAIAFCRALNIPARYCTGYLGDVGTPPPYPPGDFAASFASLSRWPGGRPWHTFDPRNNVPRIGRVLLARGRDAADVAITTTFGPNTLESFRVWTDEVAVQAPRSRS